MDETTSRNTAKRPRRGQTAQSQVVNDGTETQSPSSASTSAFESTRRTRINADQKRQLQAVFEEDGWPSLIQRQELAESMGLSVTQVSGFFDRCRRALDAEEDARIAQSIEENRPENIEARIMNSRRSGLRQLRQQSAEALNNTQPLNDQVAFSIQGVRLISRNATNNDDEPAARRPRMSFNLLTSSLTSDDRSRLERLTSDWPEYRNILDGPTNSSNYNDRNLVANLPRFRTNFWNETPRDEFQEMMNELNRDTNEQSSSSSAPTDNGSLFLRRIGTSVYDRANEITRAHALEQQAAARSSSSRSPELDLSPRRERAAPNRESAWSDVVSTVRNINATPLSPYSLARAAERSRERRNPITPIRPPVSIPIRSISPPFTDFGRAPPEFINFYNNTFRSTGDIQVQPRYVLHDMGRETVPLPPPRAIFTNTPPVSRRVQEPGFSVTPTVAIQKEVLDSFGPEGLKEEDDEEVTDIEEMVFQKLLRKKMVCDICMTHIKLFRCSKCFYSMCEDCKNKIVDGHNGMIPCPHCRHYQEHFLPIILPRL